MAADFVDHHARILPGRQWDPDSETGLWTCWVGLLYRSSLAVKDHLPRQMVSFCRNGMTGRHGCAGLRHPLRFRYRQTVHFAGSPAPYGTAMGLSGPPSCPAVACSLPACAVLFTLHSEFHTPSGTFLPVPCPFPSLPAAGSDPCCSADPPFSRRWRRDSRSL